MSQDLTTLASANRGSTLAAANKGSTLASANKGSTLASANKGSTLAAANKGSTLAAANKGEQFSSFDVNAFEVPGGRDELWRFTPLKRLRGLHDGTAAKTGNATISVSEHAVTPA